MRHARHWGRAAAALCLMMMGLMGMAGRAAPPYNGTTVGSPGYVTDAGFGQALTTGAGNYMRLGNTPATDPLYFGPTDSYTIECRVKTSSTTGTQVIVGIGQSGFLGLAAGVPQFAPTGFTVAAVGSVSIADGAWHTLAAVMQYGGVARLYADKVLVGSSTGTATVTVYNSGQSQIGAFIGNQFNFVGQIDELCISNTPRYTGSSYATPALPPVGDYGTVSLYHLDGNAADGFAPAVRLVAIGDSTSAAAINNAGVAPVSDTAAILSQQKGRVFGGANGAVPGSASANWNSGASAENTGFTGAGVNDWQYALGKAGGSLAGCFVLMRLGVNDAQQHVAAATFQSNLATLIAQIRAQGAAGIILSYPTWREPGTYAQDGTTAFDTSTTAYLLQYQAVCDAVVDGSFVFAGDKTSYALFQSQPSVYLYYSPAGYSVTGNQGAIHPSQAGTGAMGQSEAAALSQLVFRSYAKGSRPAPKGGH